MTRQPNAAKADEIKAATRHTIVTVRALAEALGVDPATLRQRIARGSLPARRVGPLWVIDGPVAARVVAAGRGARWAAGRP